MFGFRRGLNHRFGEMNMLEIFFLLHLPLSRFRKDLSPFFFLLNFLISFLPLPMWSPIVPKMKVHVKTRGYDVAEFVNLEPDLLGEHRDMEMIVAKKLYVKI